MQKSGVRPILAGIVLVLLQIMLVACSTTGTTAQNISNAQLAKISGNTHRGQNGSRKKQPVTIQIGLNLPLSGVDASQGISAEDGALLALSQARIPGYTLQLVAKNDANVNGTPDATLAASNLNALIRNTQVAGVIGAFDTPTAEAELPLANKAQLPLLSPSATSPCLTQASAAANCGTLLSTLRPTGTTTFFRLAPTDIQQAEALANFSYQTKAVRTVYIIDDTSASGVAQASGFSSQFQADGGVVRGHASVGVMSSYINLLTQITTLKPDFIFYAGSDAEGITIRQQMLYIPGLRLTFFVGGSGIHTTAFTQAINPAFGAPIYSSSPSVSLTTGSFVQQYQAKYGALGTYSAAGYDSANIFIAAIKTALARGVKPAGNGNQSQAGKQFRLAVLHALAQTTLESVTGKVKYTFTTSGDPTSNVVQIDVLTSQNSSTQWVQYVPENVM